MVIALVASFVVRGIGAGLAGNRLPPALETAIAEAYRRCDEAFPVHPGDVRMPSCDVVRARRNGAGEPPAGAAGEGVRSVVCYRVELERLYWGEMGPQKHAMAWAMRTVSKVGVFQGGTWTLFPDEEQADASRWVNDGCPGESERYGGAAMLGPSSCRDTRRTAGRAYLTMGLSERSALAGDTPDGGLPIADGRYASPSVSSQETFARSKSLVTTTVSRFQSRLRS